MNLFYTIFYLLCFKYNEFLVEIFYVDCVNVTLLLSGYVL